MIRPEVKPYDTACESSGFLNLSPLPQFYLDQTNPLAEIAHERVQISTQRHAAKSLTGETSCISSGQGKAGRPHSSIFVVPGNVVMTASKITHSSPQCEAAQ